MYPLGHAGISLVIYAPVAYVLVSRDRWKAMLIGLVALVFLTFVPDLDALIPGLAHRGVTHSVTAAICLGITAGAVGWLSGWLGSSRGFERAGLGAFVGFFGVVSHLVGDVITPWGVQPFLPLAPDLYTLNLVSARDPSANRALFVLGFGLLYATVLRARRETTGTTRSDKQPTGESEARPR